MRSFSAQRRPAKSLGLPYTANTSLPEKKKKSFRHHPPQLIDFFCFCHRWVIIVSNGVQRPSTSGRKPAVTSTTWLPISFFLCRAERVNQFPLLVDLHRNRPQLKPLLSMLLRKKECVNFPKSRTFLHHSSYCISGNDQTALTLLKGQGSPDLSNS